MHRRRPTASISLHPEALLVRSATGIGARRKTSYAVTAVDVLAAVPVISATSLARILGIAVKNAIRILDELQPAEIAIEVTHRSPLTPVQRRAFDYSALEEAMAHLDNVVREVRRNLGVLTTTATDEAASSDPPAAGAA